MLDGSDAGRAEASTGECPDELRALPSSMPGAAGRETWRSATMETSSPAWFGLAAFTAAPAPASAQS